MDRMAKRSPEQWVMIGNVVSIEVAPPADIGASFPKTRASKGAQRSVVISLMMFDKSATVPISVPLNSVMNMLDSE